MSIGLLESSSTMPGIASRFASTITAPTIIVGPSSAAIVFDVVMASPPRGVARSVDSERMHGRWAPRWALPRARPSKAVGGRRRRRPREGNRSGTGAATKVMPPRSIHAASRSTSFAAIRSKTSE
jgi:hypothetical protein